jgi:hypothetical protein
MRRRLVWYMFTNVSEKLFRREEVDKQVPAK